MLTKWVTGKDFYFHFDVSRCFKQDVSAVLYIEHFVPVAWNLTLINKVLDHVFAYLYISHKGMTSAGKILWLLFHSWHLVFYRDFCVIYICSLDNSVDGVLDSSSAGCGFHPQNGRNFFFVCAVLTFCADCYSVSVPPQCYCNSM